MKMDIKNRPRFSPIRNLTPERLTQMLDSFEQGYLAEAALTWDTIEKRDDTIKSVAPKRKKAIARHGWEVIVLPNLPCEKQAEALRHKEALEYFYTNIRCSHALDGNERGGFKLLVRQMMDAVGKRYAVHEIIWKVERGSKVEGYQVEGPVHHGGTENAEGFQNSKGLTGENRENEEDVYRGINGIHGTGGLNAKSAKSAKVEAKDEGRRLRDEIVWKVEKGSKVEGYQVAGRGEEYGLFNAKTAKSAKVEAKDEGGRLRDEIIWKVEKGSKVEGYQVAGPVHHGGTENAEGFQNSKGLTGENRENEDVYRGINGIHGTGDLNAKTAKSAKFRLSAELRFVPLWFFENTTGSLRFVKTPYLYSSGNSEELKSGAWMITAGEGLMTACSIAWMYKNLPLQDWLDFSHRYGHPALVAATSAARNSSEWLELEKVMEDFLSQLSAMTTAGEQIKLVDLKGGGDLPYERLISRMDRLITALWRGADLSTLSREQGYGASLQAGESDILEQDDAEMISETLQTHLDRHVIEYLFGKGVRPLAAVKILVTPKQSTPQDLQIDEFLINHGARLAINDTLARYGRAEANVGEKALKRPRNLTGENQEKGEEGEDRGAHGTRGNGTQAIFTTEPQRTQRGLAREFVTTDNADFTD